MTNKEDGGRRTKRKSRDSPHGKTALGLQERWEEMFERLRDFKRVHGHTLVPNRYIDDPSLGAWVSTQRRQYKILTSGSSESTPMTPDRAARLMSIGFVWSTRDPRHVPWETRFRELCEYKKKFGDCLVPIGFKDNLQLSNWVSTQRQEYRLLKDGRSSRMTPGRIQALETIGFVWEPPRGAPPRKHTRSPLSPTRTDDTQSEEPDSPTTPPMTNLTPSTTSCSSPAPQFPGFPFPGGTTNNPMAATFAALAGSMQPGQMPNGLHNNNNMMGSMDMNKTMMGSMDMNKVMMGMDMNKTMNGGMSPTDPTQAAQLCFAAEAMASEEQNVLQAMKQALMRHKQMAQEQQEAALKQEEMMMEAIHKKQQSLDQKRQQVVMAHQQFLAAAMGSFPAKNLFPTQQGCGNFGGMMPDCSSMMTMKPTTNNANNTGMQQFPSLPKFDTAGLSALAEASVPHSKVDSDNEEKKLPDEEEEEEESSPAKKRKLEDFFSNSKTQMMLKGMVPPSTFLTLPQDIDANEHGV